MSKIKLYTTFVFVLSISACFAQFVEPDSRMPEFPNGEQEMFCFIDENLNKQLLNSSDITGLMIVQFSIDTTGRIINIGIKKSLNDVLDKEIIRVLALMPKWKPAQQAGKVVEVKMNLPLKIPYKSNCLSK